MTTPELSYCTMKKTGIFSPYLLKLIEDFKSAFLTNESIDCPMKPKKIYLNFTYFMGDLEQYKNPINLTVAPENSFGLHLPNGKYRITVRGSTKADPNGLFIQWITEIYIRLHEDKF
jgi:hypothetical protein